VGVLCDHSLDPAGLAGDPDSPIHRLDPRAKIVGLLGVTAIAVSAPLELWPVWVMCLLVLGGCAAVARVPAGALWRRVRVVLPLVLLVGALVPFVRPGGWSVALGPFTAHEAGLVVFAAVAAKAVIGTASAALLGATTTFPAVLRGLEALRVPRLLVLIAGLMYRYLFVITEEVTRTRDALVSRAYRPRHALQAGAMGSAAGALFLRSYLRGERVHLAMLARGYSGRMPELSPLRLAATDLVFVAAVLAALVPLRLALA
jgi:cobalt/nickel transport system permease protein